MTPPFRARFPWWGGDLQTLRNRFVYRYRPLPGEVKALEVRLADGDTLTGTVHQCAEPAEQPLIFLVHGLTGSEDSMYMLESARHHLNQGRNVVRMNLRGAGSSVSHCRTTYSGESWPDLFAVLEQLDPALTRYGIFVVGYSMGGNILLNGLPNLPETVPCIGAATVSAPIDPISASKRLMARRNRVYENALLTDMRASHMALPLAEAPEMRQAIENAASIWAFDDTVTAPRLGYDSAQSYYAATAGKDRVAEVRLPLLMLHAEDDPWIPVAPYRALHPPQNVSVEITRSGGHVGFHGRGLEQPWHELRISDFIDGLTGRHEAAGLPSAN